MAELKQRVDLLECPFCNPGSVKMSKAPNAYPPFSIQCRRCGIKTWGCKTEEEAAAIWNNRPREKDLTEQNEKLVESIKHYMRVLESNTDDTIWMDVKSNETMWENMASLIDFDADNQSLLPLRLTRITEREIRLKTVINNFLDVTNFDSSSAPIEDTRRNAKAVLNDLGL